MGAVNSLYGKVATRRDFIAVATTQSFLSVWEPWLQSGVASSREFLRDTWIDAFLVAPVWRFWLGADICGATVLGATMPSMDGAGRYFPLTLAARADEGAEFPPPEADAQEEWFARVEDFLLSTLDATEHDGILRDFAALAPPQAVMPAEKGAGVAGVDALACRAAVAELRFADGFARCRLASPARSATASTFWWTLGGRVSSPARCHACGCLRRSSFRRC